jgi:hypothetical protein
VDFTKLRAMVAKTAPVAPFVPQVTPTPACFYARKNGSGARFGAFER